MIKSWKVFIQFTGIITLLGILTFTAPTNILAVNFTHPSDVVKEMQQRFKKMKTFMADFSIDIKENNRTKTSRGKAYYSEGGKLNFTFSQPAGDMIVSNGDKIYIYVARLRTVGTQSLNAKDKDGKNLFAAGSYKGLINLFKRYHYRFDEPEQPRQVDGNPYFILELKEKEASGGYDKILLFVNPATYQIGKMRAFSPSGRVVELKFSNAEMNANIPERTFIFKAPDNSKSVENPLTTE